MKKRWCSILTALLLLLPLAAMPASADAGPKPSVVVELTGLEGRTCWGTLLSQQEGTGPYGRFSEGETVEGPEKDRALRAMRPLDQMDPEGFYLLDFAEDCSDGELSWTYYPPHTYQIALWFPEEDALAVSAVYHRYAFDSYYRLDLSGLELTPGGIVELEAARLQRDYPYGASLLALAGRVALTLGAELLLALAFGLRTGRALRWVAYPAGSEPGVGGIYLLQRGSGGGDGDSGASGLSGSGGGGDPGGAADLPAEADG